MIEINNVTKSYGHNIGNFNLNIKINDGEVYGILGPNGAGKTTLIQQVMGFIKTDEGEILIDGVNPWKNSRKVMESVGYVAGEISLYENLKGIEYLKLVAKIKRNVDEDFLNKLIEHFDIDTTRKIKKMSKGMKQKIALISAAMLKPKFLVLDEPTSGLDPVMQEQFNKLVERLKKEGTTILMCSHIFGEVVKLCDRVGFIKDGRLIKEIAIQSNDILKLENEFKSLFGGKEIL
ncbi:ATP-binding cassette domain-containing protein [Spiroplasma endosymbiont of Labia minor]|uniref:ABC transporter ATP-binding protein n=1 Tax=Spiroplasma endosymbiont of Labia minor TaxID=3066305 RepID=UPI0030D42635